MIKLYKTANAVSSALKRQGISGMNHKVLYMDAKTSGFYAEITVDNMEDFSEISSRGLKAVLQK